MSYEDTCRQLIEQGFFDETPPMPERMPSYGDDTPLGIEFFRGGLEEADLSSLTMPRTFFSRSLVAKTSFKNTDLSESCLCWSDFTDVNFEQADLSSSDLRASLYERVSFVSARLDGADLRRSSFADCRFDGASMRGVLLTYAQKPEIGPSMVQAAEIFWTDDVGPQPSGG